MKSNKMLVNGSLFSLFSFVNKGVGFILLIILAKFILPADYGILSLFNTIVSFIGLFICLSTDGYITISFFQKSEQEFKKDVGAVFVVLCAMALIFIFFVPIIGDYISQRLSIDFDLLWIAIIIAFFSCIFNIHQNLYIIKEAVARFGIFNCSNAIMNFGVSLILVVLFKRNWLGRIEAQFLVTVFWGLLSLILMIRKKYIVINDLRNRIKEVLLYGIPIIPHLSTAWIKQGCDQFIINSYYSVYEVGVFSFALNMTSVIVMIGVAFNSTNSVSLFKTLSDNLIKDKIKVLKKKNSQMLIVYFMLTLFVVVVMNALILFFLPKYLESLSYFYLLSVYGFLQCVYLLYCNYFFYYKCTKQLMYITLGTSFLHLLLSLIFTRYSLYYTAVIYIVSQILIDVLVLVIGQKILNNKLLYEEN